MSCCGCGPSTCSRTPRTSSALPCSNDRSSLRHVNSGTRRALMNDISAPVAARTQTTEITSDANLHVQVGAPTRRFHLWVQGPAWLLGFAAVALGFVMVLTGYDSSAGWFAVSTAITLSVVGSFRAPFTLGETSVSTVPGKRVRKPKATNPPTG